MIATTYDRCAVPHLLDLLVHHQSNTYWCQRNFYINEAQEGVSEVIVYVGHYQKIKGILEYNTHTGQVVNLRYNSYLKTPNDTDDVVDTLLDLINFEKSFHSVLV